MDRTAVGTPLKLLGGAALAVAVGAIGSGVWEVVISPISERILRMTVSAFGAVAETYVDGLYDEVGYGLHEHMAFLPYVAISILAIVVNIVFLAVFIIARTKVQKSPEDLARAVRPPSEKVIRIVRSKGLLVFAVAMTVFNLVVYTEGLVSTGYKYRTVIWLERSLEIVRPQVSQPAFLELRAQYRSVDEAEDFKQLYSRLKQIATKDSIALPEFEPIGL